VAEPETEPGTEVEDPVLAAARFLLYQLHENPPDVLVFGESTLTFVGSHEADQRSLADLLVAALAPLSSFVVAGPGFGVDLHREFIRLASTQVPRPIVVTTLYTRGTLPAFRCHPVWGHRRQVELLRGASGRSVEELQGQYVPPDADAWAAYEAMAYPTRVDAQRTIADFMAALRPPSNPFSREHMRWLFEFHCGGIPDPAAVESFTHYGRALREAGYPVIAFQNPVDVVQGAEALGPEFVEWHRSNTRLIREAFVAGYGAEAVILETAELWQPADFAEPAVEHLAARARGGLANLIAEAVREVGGVVSPSYAPSV
jgi:hypothetical protein